MVAQPTPEVGGVVRLTSVAPVSPAALASPPATQPSAVGAPMALGGDQRRGADEAHTLPTVQRCLDEPNWLGAKQLGVVRAGPDLSVEVGGRREGTLGATAANTRTHMRRDKMRFECD